MPSMYSSQFTSRKWHTGISTVVSFPNEPEGERLLCVGNKAIIEKKYEEALRLYADGLAIARGVDLKATLISNRCSAFAYQEKWAEALVLANECVALRPDWPRAYFCQGSALEGVGSVSEALRAYEKALSLDPEDEELRATVAELQVQVSTMQPEETAERPDMAAVSRVQPGASVIGTVGLMYWPQDGELIITVIKSDSHAFTSGVETGDVILEVNNTVVGTSARQVSSMLVGPLGSEVTMLCLRRSGLSRDTFVFVLKRDVELDESSTVESLQEEDKNDVQMPSAVNEDESVMREKTVSEHKVPRLSQESIALPKILPSHRSAASDQALQQEVSAPSERKQEQSVTTEKKTEMGTLGLMLWADEGRSEVQISAIKPGSSVASAGLETGDVLKHVDDTQVDITSLDSVIKKMSGPLGSTIRLTVSRTRGESIQVKETIVAEVERDVASPRKEGQPVHDAQQKHFRGESMKLEKLEEPQKIELFQTKLRDDIQKSSVKHFTCGFGCGFITESENEVEKHESFDCRFKDSTLAYNNTTAQEQDRKDKTKSITPQTYHDVQRAIDRLRYEALSEKYPNAVETSHRPTSPAHEPASNDNGTPNTWQFRCLGSSKIAGKFRRGDEVVCMVKRDLGMGSINVGDIGIVMAECFTPNAVQVRFQLGMLELDASSEVRKCLYQDIVRIERERKAAESRQRILEDTVAEKKLEDTTHLAANELKKTSTMPVGTHTESAQLAHMQSMAAPKTKDSFK